MSALARALRGIWDWLGRVPDAADDRARRQAALTIQVLRVLLASVPLCVLGALLAPHADHRVTLAVYGPTFLMDVAVLMLARRGHPRAAAAIITAVAWAIITSVVFLSGGLSANHGVSLIAVTMIAGTLLGPTAGVRTALLCVTTTAAALAAENLGVLPVPLIEASAVNTWLATSFALVVVALLHNLAIRSMDHALEQHRVALDALHAARAENEERARRSAALAQLGRDALNATSPEALVVLAVQCLRRFHPTVTPFLLAPSGADAWNVVGPDGTTAGSGLLALPARTDTLMRLDAEDPATRWLCTVFPSAGGPLALVHVPGRSDRHAWLCVLGALPVTELEVALMVSVAEVLGNALERAAADERALRGQKLEAVGRMAGGVAHDFNNILTAVMSASAALREGTENTDDILDDLDHAARSGRLLNRQLLAFSQRGSRPPQQVDLGALVADFAPLLRRLLGSAWLLEVSVPAEPLVILGDTAQLEQVVLNLVVNARDALANGGTIQCVLRAEGGGQHALLQVVDRGCGMDEPTRRRALQPFFSTKETGTGLGLATVADVAARLRGTLDIESAVGRGTTVTVRFPRCAVEAPVHSQAGAPDL